jgi:putrescine importer
MSNGHALLTILIAMVAMVLTAFSYGRMAALYPSAGSAYTYVGRGLNPHLGFLAGWAMLLDYIVIPLFCVIYGSLAGYRLIPQIPYPVWALMFASTMTFLNLRGIRSTARANQILLTFMCTVLLAFIALAIRYLFHLSGWGGVFSTLPFYNPRTFNLDSVRRATSFAALTYLGFDAVTTLAEDVQNPRRNVLLATVVVVSSPVFSEACWFTWVNSFGRTTRRLLISKLRLWMSRGVLVEYGSSRPWRCCWSSLT